ncbi:MAG: hypothetical protein Q9179_006704, partial [Wetmoreana sp. 5 TL-2023]
MVLCTQSKFFEAACFNGFKESTASRIDLSENDPCYITLMIDFLYTQNYDPTTSGICSFKLTDTHNIPQTHLSIQALGD